MAPHMEALKRERVAFELRLIPAKLWRACWKMIGDESGTAARDAWSKVPATTRVRMLRASLGMYGRESARYRWSDMRARRISALAYALYELAKRGKRRGQWAGGLVVGVTRRALCFLLRNPYDDRESSVPSISALAGTHRKGASAESGEVGYMIALKAAGFCYSQQLPHAAALPCERWHHKYTSARYWLASSVYERTLAEIGIDAGALLEFSAGWVKDGEKIALTRLFALPPPLAAS